MNSLHFHLHALPPVDCKPVGSVQLFGLSITNWQVEYIDRFAMEVSFEQVALALSQLPRMFFELDGSFVWCGESIDPKDSSLNHWQIDGMVYDVGGRVSRVELKGRCPVKKLVELVEQLQPAEKLLAFCIDQGCFVRVDELLQVWNR